jgi:glycosyltransferase involved in cell wall biosynthesis
MRVLFLSPYIPSKVRIRPYSWIRTLAALGHEVHLVALQPPEDTWTDGAELRSLCSAVDVLPLSRRRTLINGLLTLPTRQPLQLAYAHLPAAERHVARLAASRSFDVVHVEHLRGVALASRLRDLPLVWDAVDSITALFDETRRLAPGRGQRSLARLDLARTRRFEAQAPFRFDRTVVTSPADADAFVRLAGPDAGSRIAVVPNGVDTAYFRPATTAGREGVIFTGKLSYHANAAAVLRLVRDIMPRVWARRPDTPVRIVGKDPTPAIRDLAKDGRVAVTGYVEDLRPSFASAAVAACPLVYGVGIQNKVLEAMASGVPVVTTPGAAAALLAEPERDLLVADDDAAFADAIRGLLDAPQTRETLGEAGRAYVEREHQWPRLGGRLTSVYRQAGAQRAAVLQPGRRLSSAADGVRG